MGRAKITQGYAFGLLVWILAFWAALQFGSVNGADQELITQLRLPRALLASAIGMGLSVSGAVLQALFSNPLCEPYTLGISSGSALGAVLGASLGMQWMVFGLAGTGFIGALVFAGILYFISLRAGRGSVTLLLAGVMLGFLGSSLVALWMALSDPNGVQGAVLWLLGDLSRIRVQGALLSLSFIVALTLLIWRNWRGLDAFLMGEEGAITLGVSVAPMRRRLILLSSLMIGLCVSAGGMIGFVGLVVPHLARRFSGSLHFRLIPLCAIWGAATLTLADVVARVAVRPYDLPVGVVTALIGAPLFLWVMLKQGEYA